MVLLSGTFVGGVQALVRLQFGIDAEMQVRSPVAQYPCCWQGAEVPCDARLLAERVSLGSEACAAVASQRKMSLKEAHHSPLPV